MHRWLLAMARTITPMPLMMGHAAIAERAAQRLLDTCAAAPVFGDLAWRALGAISPLLPLRTRSHIHKKPFRDHIDQRVLTTPPHFLDPRAWGSRRAFRAGTSRWWATFASAVNQSEGPLFMSRISMYLSVPFWNNGRI